MHVHQHNRQVNINNNEQQGRNPAREGLQIAVEIQHMIRHDVDDPNLNAFQALEHETKIFGNQSNDDVSQRTKRTIATTLTIASSKPGFIVCSQDIVQNLCLGLRGEHSKSDNHVNKEVTITIKNMIRSARLPQAMGIGFLPRENQPQSKLKKLIRSGIFDTLAGKLSDRNNLSLETRKEILSTLKELFKDCASGRPAELIADIPALKQALSDMRTEQFIDQPTLDLIKTVERRLRPEYILAVNIRNLGKAIGQLGA